MAKKKNNKSRKRLVVFGLSSLCLITFLLITIGKYWIEIYGKYQEKKFLSAELLKLKEEEESLRLDALKLQDPDYIARYAREKYLYSKDGEFIIRIP